MAKACFHKARLAMTCAKYKHETRAQVQLATDVLAMHRFGPHPLEAPTHSGLPETRPTSGTHSSMACLYKIRLALTSINTGQEFVCS